MPELPDIQVYLDALQRRLSGRVLRGVSIRGPFLLRTFEPAPDEAVGRGVTGLSRLGKRIVIEFEGELFFVLHLMIAGRLLWKAPGTKATGRIDQAAFAFDEGTLVLTEAGTKKRASLHVVAGRAALAAHDPGGIDPLTCSAAEFAAALTSVNRTVKRALTDPASFSGIGNAYSDEILHAARLSPYKRTGDLSEQESEQLHRATVETLTQWIARLREDFEHGERFPGTREITAFRPDFAVHVRFGKPCPVCRHPVQRIALAENEINYCASCQTQGRVLSDRSLARLLRDEWPSRIEEWEGSL